MRIAIGLDLARISVARVAGVGQIVTGGCSVAVAAKLHDLLVCLHGLRGLVLFAVDDGKPIQEGRAVLLLLLGVLAIGVRGGVENAGQYIGCLAVFAQCVVDERLVVAEFERILHLRLRLLQGCQRLVVVALATLNLGDANLRLRVRGIRCH